MHAYTLNLRLAAPLAVRAERGTGYQSSTLTTVPPPMLRGSLAACLRHRGRDADVLFSEAFGEGGLRTTDLAPVHIRGEGAGTARPPVLTLLSCKQYGGPAGDEGAHGLEDVLFATLAYAVEGDASHLRSLDRQGCPHCRNVLRPYRSALCRGAEGHLAEAPSPSKRVQVHVGIDRRRHGAASGIFYAREVVEEQPEDEATWLYQARVTGSEEIMTWLAQQLTPGTVLRIGNAVSRGLGRCEVHTFAPVADAAPSAKAVRERAERFTEAARDYVPSLPEEARLVAVTLETPALFVDAFLRPSLSPDGAALLQAASSAERGHAAALRTMQRVHQVARPYTFTGWNGLAGFPHSSDHGLTVGSVLVFQTGASPEDGLWDALAHVERAGIGLRRHLGFGHVHMCDPIHVTAHELRPEATA